MYLSKLELNGFKSFPKKTVLRFDEGVTAIVGPNGCGKSNIIDAIRWVIGEQRASVLRSDKMENVIFNGTGQRKQLGMAEVALTIENTKGLLPTEYSEVTISRRLFRNGDSEYLLNKAQCRLKDIVELFMDTGMGANAYSVIELKMIETILSDRTGDRRQLFEEAAGVTRYKQRRREALRKLEATRGDLERVSDILREVSKKVRSLEKQAGKAEEYKVLEDDRVELETMLLKRDYASALNRIEPLVSQLNEAQSARTELDSYLAKEELTLRELEREQSEIETLLAEANRDVESISERIAKVEQNRAVGTERVSSLRSAIERGHLNEKEAREALVRIGEDRESIESTLAEIREQKREAREHFEELEARVKVEQEALQSRKDAVQSARQKVMEAVDQIGELRADAERASTRIDSLRKQRERFDQEDRKAEQQSSESERALVDLNNRIDAAQRDLKTANNEFDGAESRKKALREDIDSLTTTSTGIRDEINSRQARIEFLAGLVDMTESVQFLIGSDDWGQPERITVADVISTDREYVKSVAAALGSASSYLVVDSFDNAAGAVRLLSDHHKGRATFVCLDRLPPVPTRVSSADDRILARAAEVCRSDSKYDAMREFLLGDTVIVSSVEDAIAVTESGDVSQAATIDGVLVRSGGIVHGGGAESNEESAIGRQERIRNLEAEVEDRERRLAEVTRKITGLKEEYESINLKAFSEQVQRAQEIVGEIAREKNTVEFRIRAAAESIQEHAEERSRIDSEVAELEARLEGIEPQRQELVSAKEASENDVGKRSEELEEFEREFNQLTSELNARKIALVELQGEEKGAISELERLQREREQSERTIETSHEEVRRAEEDIEHLTAQIEENDSQLESFKKESDEAREARDRISRRQSEKRAEISEHSERLRTERKGYEDSIELAHQLEVKIGELRARAEGLKERALEEFELKLSPETVEVDDETPVGELRERLRDVKSKIKLLGNVNLLAYEEYAEESERLAFIDKQVSDLTEAENDLVETIEEINDTAQRQFLETFEQIRDSFRGIFQSLFHEGDEADLVIDEEHGDVLEARIEIVAKPRGKRPHSIDLLSGGEKTLTAIALLFAIYLVKPSPFCILDEVDAPLDDANVERFVRLIREFDKNTQFVIVTHNKKTMAAADTVFGVTQQEDGVSEILRNTFLKKDAAPAAAA